MPRNQSITFYFLFIFLLLGSGKILSQNLIKNGDFENYYFLPIISNLEQCEFWYNPSFGSPDYFHTNAPDPEVTIPKNWFGFQYPHSGDGYIGIHMYDELYHAENREYVKTELIQPLEVGDRYRLEYWVSLGYYYYTYGTPPQAAFYPFKNQPNYYPIITEPEVYSTQIIKDTSNWIKISKDFVADRECTHLLIGNFFNLGDYRFYYSSDTIGFGGRKLDFYIDDVSLIRLPPPFPDLGPDIVMCDNETRTLSFDSEGYTYLWSTGETTKSIQVTKAGKYFLTIERKGLTNSDTIIVTTKPLPIINLGIDTGICTSDSLNITLTSEEGSYFLWKPLDSTTQSIHVNNYGTYSVHSLLENGCSNNDTIRIYDNCPPCFSTPSVYPNPVKEQLQFSFLYNYNKQHVRYRIVCDNGQIALSDYVDLKKGVNKLNINLPTLNTGIYFLEMDVECGKLRYPIMVKQND